MNGFFWATYVLLWLTTGVLVVAVVLMFRQFGLSYMEPRRRLDLQQGPDIGSRSPEVAVKRIRSGEPVILEWGNGQGPHLLLFARPGCLVCKDLVPTVDAIPEFWPGVRFVWIDSAIGNVGDKSTALSLKRWDVVSSDDESAHEAMDVAATPFTIVVGADGKVLSKGVVNSAEDVAGVLEAADETALAAPGRLVVGRGREDLE